MAAVMVRSYSRMMGQVSLLQNTGSPGAGGAIGYYMIDTTTLTNSVHTIAWVARNTAGGATGMGSRYFTVANP